MPRFIRPIPSRIHDQADRTDETVNDRGEGLKAATGLTETTAVKASGTYVFTGNPAADDTITVNGVVFTFKAAVTGANQILIGADQDATGVNTAAALEASTDDRVSMADYAFNAGTNTLTITHKSTGAGGNGFTIAENSTAITVSGATLSGGVTNRYANVIKNFMHGD